MIQVNTAVLAQQAVQFQRILQALEQVSQDVSAANQRLNWDVSVSRQIRQTLGQYDESVLKISEKVQQLSSLLNRTVEKYQAVETQNGSLTQGGAAQPKSDSDDNHIDNDSQIRAEKWKDFVKTLQKWFEGSGDMGEWDSVSYIGSSLGLLYSLFELDGGEDFSALDWYAALTKLSKESTELIENLHKLMGDDVVGDEWGVMAGMMEAVNALSKLSDLSIAELLRQNSDLIESGGSLAEALYALIGEKELSALDKAGQIAIVSSIAAMASRLVGDVMVYSKDGCFNWDDLSDTCLETGISGGATLIKGLTFGIFDIDVNGAVDIFHRNTDSLKEILWESDLPLWEKIVAVIPGSVAVASMSVGEVFWNTADELGTKIDDGLAILVDLSGGVIKDAAKSFSRWFH